MARIVDIFLSFLKIGAFTFGGGYAMIPIIQHEVITCHKWIAKQEFIDLLTLAQTAPGPISLNTAVFVGYKCRGFMGALAAILGVILPSFLVILAVAVFFSEIRDNRWIDAAFKGMRPAVVALIVAPIVGLAKGMRWILIALAAATALVVWYFAISPVWFLVAGAVGGLLWAARGKEVEQ
jgi:chromate transporter